MSGNDIDKDGDERARRRREAYSRAQEHARAPRLRRFYRTVGVGTAEEGHTVELDGRPARTPGRSVVAVPTRALAEAVAEEWAAQGEFIDAAAMPLMRLVNAAVEAGPAATGELAAQIVKYAGNDLMLYRADAPRELVAAQEAAWDPVLVALARRLGVAFRPTVGIIHQAQPEATLDRIAASLSQDGHMALTAMASITNITGSGLLTVAFRQGLIEADTAWHAAHVDEDYNVRLWGEDAEATELRSRRRREFDAAVAMLERLRA